jgi:acetyltransferase-like isoleucine patch superfamily enzyme
MRRNLRKAFDLFRENPLGLLKMLRALFKGSLYIAFYRLTKPGVRIEFPFFAHAPLRIYGEGKVHIHKNCSSLWNVFKGATIVTLSPQAELVIGEGCDLGGVTIRCSKKIEIGARSQTAFSLIQDTLFVNRDKCRSRTPSLQLKLAKDIRIGCNTWLCAQAAVLPGATVGDKCVLGSGSLCLDANIPDCHLSVGSPASRSIKIDSLINLLGKQQRL